MTLVVYLSGPMRGIPAGNRPAFEAAARHLRRLGYLVWSPLEHDDATGVDAGAELSAPALQSSMRWDLRRVMDADIVVFLNGWWGSRGCTAEHLVAWYAGKPCYELVPLLVRDEPARHRLVKQPPYHEPTVVPNPAWPEMRRLMRRLHRGKPIGCITRI